MKINLLTIDKTNLCSFILSNCTIIKLPWPIAYNLIFYKIILKMRKTKVVSKMHNIIDRDYAPLGFKHQVIAKSDIRPFLTSGMFLNNFDITTSVAFKRPFCQYAHCHCCEAKQEKDDDLCPCFDHVNYSFEVILKDKLGK